MRKRTMKKLLNVFKIMMAIVLTITLLNVSNLSALATDTDQEDTIEEVLENQDGSLESEEEQEETIEESETKTEYVYEDSKVKVTVKLQEGTTIDTDAELSVTEIKEGTESYNNAISQLDDDNVIDCVIYDISFISNGEEVEPDGKVDVSIEFIKNVLSMDDDYNVVVTHISDDGDVETLDAQVDTNDGDVEGVSFTTSSFSEYVISLDGTLLAAGSYGNYTLSYNEITDAFESSSYYNASSLLGVAGNFHLVGFGTVTLNAHTNGNVLAYELIAKSNFGTNGLTDELSYVQNYTTVNATSASSTNHTLVLGSNNTLTTADNGNAIAVNGTKLDKPYNIIQDTDTDANPYIDLDGVKAEIEEIAATLSSKVTTNGVEIHFENNNNYITLADSSGASYVNLTASEINDLYTNYNGDLKLMGFTTGSDGTLIINVDCTGVETINMPNAIVYVDGQAVSTNEVTEFSNGKVIWNFTNTTTDTVINANRMTGMILAPNATVNINQNLNGTVVATNINVNAESHRTDFTGTLSVSHDAIKTVDGQEPTSSQTFTFNLYELVNGSWNLIDTKTNSGSDIKFDDLTYTSTGTFWYLMEEEVGTDNYDYSSDLYLVKIVITNTDNITADSTTYYKVTSTVDDIDDLITNGTIDESALTTLSSKSDLVFNNRELISVEGSKGWVDTTDSEVKGQTITMVLQRRIGNEDWENVDSIDLTISDVSTVSFTFDNLYKYDENGNLYEYRVRELGSDGSVIEDSGGQTTINGNGYEVNYYSNNSTINEKDDETEIDGHKRWLDNQNAYSTRPDSVTVVLLQSELTTDNYTGIDDTTIHWVSAVDNDGNAVSSQTVSDATNWQYSFTNLDDDYYYVVREVDSNGNEYAAGDTYTTSSGATYTVTYNDTNNNIYNTLTGTTSLEGTKVWHDNSNAYQTRTSITILLQYEVNGVWYAVTDTNGNAVTKTLNINSYGFEFTNLDKYDSNGVLINYRVVELDSNGDILYDGSSFSVGNDGDTYVVSYDESTNTITNTLTGTTEVSGTKTWNDNNNNDRVRPSSITVWLRQDETFYQSAVVTADDNWTYTFTNLPKYDDNGELYTYVITEEDVENYVPSYTTEGNYYDITNTYDTEKTSVNVTKTWVDNSNQDGYRPSSVDVELYANGSYVDTVTLNDSNSWFYRWSDLDKYGNGVEITYTVKEVVEDSWGQYYTSVLTGSQSLGYDMINTHVTETTEIAGTKIWDDDSNRDGIRPSEVYVGLFAEGLDDPIAVTTTSEADNWEYSFTNLPAKSQGYDINYYVRELDSAGNIISEGGTLTVTGGTYTVTYDDNYNITNTHEIITITISGEKTWSDGASHYTGSSIILYLFEDEAQTELVHTAIVTPDSNGQWLYEFTNLPKYENGGQLINYVIVESTINNYVPTVTKDTTSSEAEYTFDIYNTYTPGLTSATVEKIWNDNYNQDGYRPDSIEVTLQYYDSSTDKWVDVGDIEYNGEVVDNGTVILDSSNNWFHRWQYLDENYTYQVVETIVEDSNLDKYYTVSYTTATNLIGMNSTDADNDFVIMNTHNAEKMTVAGTKTWTDDGTIRPEKIIVYLLANGNKVDSQEVTPNAAGNWVYTFGNLDKYSNGEEILYTVEEEAIDGYEASVTGYDIENTQTVGQLTFYKTVEGTDMPENTLFTLKDSNGNVVDSVYYYEFKDTGSYTFENLLLGETYILEESGASVAYYSLYYTTNGFDNNVELSSTYNGSVTLNEYVQEVTLTNIYKQGSLDITKSVSSYDIADDEILEFSFIVTSGSAERGNLLYWYIDDNGITQSTIDSSARVVVTVDSTGSGTTTLTGLPIWTFTVTEDTCATIDDYTLVSTTYKVDEDETQTIGASVDGHEIIVTNTYTKLTGSLVITKISNGTTTPDDAIFTIYYADTDEVLTTISYSEFVDGIFTLDNVPVGNYTVVESGAEIDGYTLEVAATSIDVTINEDSETSITFTNSYSDVEDEEETTVTTEETTTEEVEDNVQTGDNQNTMIYAGLIILAVIAIFALSKKKHVE